jgi:hypothetical protein
MKKLVNEHAECPYVGLRAINIVDESFGGHIDRRAYIDVFEFFPISKHWYLVNLAKPKSAIFACPECIKTFATFRSL